jgi:hypothetical protein
MHLDKITLEQADVIWHILYYIYIQTPLNDYMVHHTGAS